MATKVNRRVRAMFKIHRHCVFSLVDKMSRPQKLLNIQLLLDIKMWLISVSNVTLFRIFNKLGNSIYSNRFVWCPNVTFYLQKGFQNLCGWIILPNSLTSDNLVACVLAVFLNYHSVVLNYSIKRWCHFWRYHCYIKHSAVYEVYIFFHQCSQKEHLQHLSNCQVWL